MAMEISCSYGLIFNQNGFSWIILPDSINKKDESTDSQPSVFIHVFPLFSNRLSSNSHGN